MDIDFIKWVIKKAGFKFDDYNVYIGEAWYSWESIQNEGNWKLVYWPFMLQRAIEGVNMENLHWEIKADGQEIHLIHETCSERYYELITNIDAAKESALKYVKDQEKS